MYIMQQGFLISFMKRHFPPLLVLPDAGAEMRLAFVSSHSVNKPALAGEKVRFMSRSMVTVGIERRQLWLDSAIS